jgi:hypothetical protein
MPGFRGGGMKRKALVLMGLLAVLSIILTACSSGAVPQEIVPPDLQIEQASESDEVPAQQIEEPEEAAAAVEESAPKVPREGLEATNPASVVLASGQPQIVEFFAFW